MNEQNARIDNASARAILVKCYIFLTFFNPRTFTFKPSISWLRALNNQSLDTVKRGKNVEAD